MINTKIKSLKRAVTLTEILVSVLLFALAALPLYKAISSTAKKEIYQDKVATAQRILNVFHQEIQNMPYEQVKLLNPIDGNHKSPPGTFQALLEVSEKEKDFNFTAKLEPEDVHGVETLKITAEVTWTRTGSQESKRTISFVKVKK
ncbi:MAG: hypothetical protein GX221_03085 [Candidatus Riflebacteria bacterium]|nr:hypothetical protein [Candidatus Riflebacteria bacterium]